MQHPDDPLATETIENRRRVEAEDAKFRAALSQALQRGEETLQGCVGRHERLGNRMGTFQAIELMCEGAPSRRFPSHPPRRAPFRSVPNAAGTAGQGARTDQDLAPRRWCRT
jgi:hypothetical protein